MSLFPVFIKLAGRSCLVVGAGKLGEAKIRSLLETGARLRVVAPGATAAVVEWAAERKITWEAREFSTADLDGTFLVIAATASAEVNDLVFREARRRGVLSNVVDDPARCDFYYPAVLRRGDLQIAISTGGQSPALAHRLRRELEDQFGPEYGDWVEHLGEERRRLLGEEMETEQRRRLLHQQAGQEAYRAFIRELGPAARRENSQWKGKVYLIGAGPGDPELLTRKAWRVLRAADVVLHDDLVSQEILALAPPHAQVFNVGKRCGQKRVSQEEINALMVGYAQSGLTVVRLKGGDPEIFSRLGQEIEALREAEVEFEIVPGITAAFAAAASAAIPLTDRRLASSLVFIPGHVAPGKSREGAWQHLLPDSTVVVYMPGSDYQTLAGQLSDAGLSLDTPCLIVSRASRPDEERHLTTLEHLPEAALRAAPSVIIVGAVAALGRDAREKLEACVAAGYAGAGQ